MGLQDLPDSDFDALLGASLRKTESIRPQQQREGQERLLAAASSYVPALVPHRFAWHRLGSVFWRPFARWWYALLFEETRYDRARLLPERALANRWRARFMEEYLVIRPAY